MKEFTIKCNNKKEAEFAVKYFIDKGVFFINKNIFSNRDWVIYPIILYTIENINKLYWEYDANNFSMFKNITEAKILMRNEKLKRIC